MILRSVTQHIKDQNWFAVIVDFAIVVIGVFVGLQVQEWANDRERQKRESVYLDRLHEEIVRAEQLRSDNVQRRKRTFENLKLAHVILTNPDDPALKESNICSSLIFSSVMSDITPDLPTLAELLSAGQLDTLRSANVRSSIINLIQQRDRSGDAMNSMRRYVTPLHKKYPELIRLKGNADLSVSDGGPGLWNASCDFPGLGSNQSFKNDLVDIRVRYLSYIGIIDSTTESLKQLHNALDETLGIKHPEEKTES